MFLDFLLSPITDKNTFTGGVIDNYSKIQDSRRRVDLMIERKRMELKQREVEALEKIASNGES